MIDRDHRDLRKPRDADCTKSVPVMTEALASTPESRRYVFCLAQSYGNAGRMGRGGVVCATPGDALLPAGAGGRWGGRSDSAIRWMPGSRRLVSPHLNSTGFRIRSGYMKNQ